MNARAAAGRIVARLLPAAAALLGCGTPPRTSSSPPSRNVAEVLDGEVDTGPVELAAPVSEDAFLDNSRGPDERPSLPGGVRVTGEGVFDYRFDKAPVDWLVAAGEWGMAPRWTSDPDKTFFCGTPRGWPECEGREKAAVVWNKRSFRGDVTVEAWVGPRMDPTGRFKRYEYARDFNVTVAADGKDLTTGYTFTYGGFGNTRSAILRGDETLAEDGGPRARYPAGSMVGGRRWFNLRAERSGSRLSFRVGWSHGPSPLVELEAEDPEPLEGDRVAIWTYDCPVAVARVRVSALPGTLAPGVDLRRPERTRTFYDETAR